MRALPEGSVLLQGVAELGRRQPLSASKDIFNEQGVKLLEGGVRIDQGLYDRLISHRLSLPLDECIEAEDSVDGAALRQAAEEAMARWAFFAQMGSSPEQRAAILDAIAATALPKPIALHLTLARTTRPALFEHSVLMALLCAYLTHQTGGSTAEVSTAASAGLLHDLGMLHIDAEKWTADTRLTGAELKPLYVHPMTSSMLVNRFPEYPKEIVRAIVEHHEYPDGSGYPRGLVGDAISPLGRMLSLAEVVTAMFDGEREFPEQRVSLLLRINPLRYDTTLAPVIHRLLCALPPPAADAGAPAAGSIASLRALGAALLRWRDIMKTLLPQQRDAHRTLLQSVSEQTDSLQRMLYEAGITPDQLAIVGEGGYDDPLLRIELWALARELHWQLHALANQLQRRWRAAEPARPYPKMLDSWVDGVKSFDPRA